MQLSPVRPNGLSPQAVKFNRDMSQLTHILIKVSKKVILAIIIAILMLLKGFYLVAKFFLFGFVTQSLAVKRTMSQSASDNADPIKHAVFAMVHLTALIMTIIIGVHALTGSAASISNIVSAQTHTQTTSKSLQKANQEIASDHVTPSIQAPKAQNSNGSHYIPQSQLPNGIKYVNYKGIKVLNQLYTDAPANSRQAFINKIAPAAQYVAAKYGVLASVIVSQAVIESDSGKSALAANDNNFFGIKGDMGYGTVNYMTGEQRADGSRYTINAAFAKFPDNDLDKALEGNAKVLRAGTPDKPNRYAKTWVENNHGDYMMSLTGLREGGYATSLDYQNTNSNMIATYGLNVLDYPVMH